MTGVTARAHPIGIAVILASVLLLHIAIAYRYPVVYGGDTIIRLVSHSRVIISYQLPLFQLLVHATTRLYYGPAGIWILMGVVSGLGAAGLFLLTRELTQDPRAAWLAGLFYAVHPFILFHSLVPYQEPLLLAALAFGFYFLFLPPSRLNLALSGALFGMACLTRYEGWIGAAVALAYRLWRMKKEQGTLRWGAVVLSAVSFGWAPVLWLVYNRGLSPAGTFILDVGFHWARLHRPYFIAISAIWWSESALVLAALLGFAVLWPGSRQDRDRGSQFAILSFLLLYFAALTISGHGVEPDPVRYVTEREAFVPVAFLIVYASAGLSRLALESQRWLAGSPVMRRAVLLLGLIFLASVCLHKGTTRIAAANSDPQLKTDYEVAHFLRLKRARALILARPLPVADIENYLRQAEKSGGLEGRENAMDILRQTETTPFDYQRVLAFSWLGKESVVSGDLVRDFDREGIEAFIRRRRIDYLVVFSDFAPVEEHERILLSLYSQAGFPEAEIQNGNRAARVYRIFS